MTKYIIISGVDGSGKTSVIEGVRKELEKQGLKVGYIWMRYNHKLVKIMHALAKLIGLSKKTQTPMGNMWLHYFYKSNIFSWFYIRCSYIDNWLARKKPVFLARKNNFDVVICDRWVNDIIIDLGSETHRISILNSVWFKRFQNLVPTNSFQFVVVRGRKEVLDCRVENSFNEAFSYRYDLYQNLSKMDGIHLVDNTGTIDNSVQQVLKVLNHK